MIRFAALLVALFAVPGIRGDGPWNRNNFRGPPNDAQAFSNSNSGSRNGAQAFANSGSSNDAQAFANSGNSRIPFRRPPGPPNGNNWNPNPQPSAPAIGNNGNPNLQPRAPAKAKTTSAPKTATTPAGTTPLLDNPVGSFVSSFAKCTADSIGTLIDATNGGLGFVFDELMNKPIGEALSDLVKNAINGLSGEDLTEIADSLMHAGTVLKDKMKETGGTFKNL